MAVTYIDGVLYVDNSILSTYATCPLKAMISYGLDRRPVGPENPNLKMGKAIHTALEYYFTKSPPQTCLNILKAEYEDWAKQNIFDNKRLSWQNIENVFKSWMNKYPQNKLPFRVALENVEIAVDVPLNKEGDIIFTGRIDMLAHARYGESMFAVDHKCTGTLDARKKKEYSMTSQMSGYLWALREMGKDISGIYINAVHVGVVPTSERKCKTHKVYYEECGFLHMNHELMGPYHRSDDDLNEWHQDALLLAQEWKSALDYVDGDITKINDLQQRGKWIYQGCVNCDWYDYCKSGKPNHWINEQTVIDPWKPGVLGDE